MVYTNFHFFPNRSPIRDWISYSSYCKMSLETPRPPNLSTRPTTQVIWFHINFHTNFHILVHIDTGYLNLILISILIFISMFISILSNIYFHINFHINFYINFLSISDILQHMFSVVTDTSHTAGLTMHATILAYVFALVESGKVNISFCFRIYSYFQF